MSLGMSIGIPKNATSVWTPLLLSNLAGWYDVSQSSGVVESGGTISQLSDLSGNARHLIQGSATKRPTLTVAGQNGLNVATFDGVDDFMTVAWIQAQPFSIAIAFKARANSAGSSVIVGLGPWSGLDQEFYMSTGSRALTKIGAQVAMVSSLDFSDGNFSTAVGVFNAASSIQARNGVEQTGTIFNRTTTAISLGDSPDETSVNSAITVGELIVGVGAWEVNLQVLK
jgi:hypothetical protein